MFSVEVRVSEGAQMLGVQRSVDRMISLKVETMLEGQEAAEVARVLEERTMMARE